MKDYYKALNISKNASSEAIHEAYRKAVKKYHPDVADTGNHERFLEVREAYEVLGDPERRREYDRTVGTKGHYSERKGSFYGYSRRSRSPVRPMRRDYPVIRAELLLSPQEAYSGGIFTIDVPLSSICPRCGGDFWLFWLCDVCGGTGVVIEKLSVDVKVPPRVFPGMVILREINLPDVGWIRMEFICKIYKPTRPGRMQISYW